MSNEYKNRSRVVHEAMDDKEMHEYREWLDKYHVIGRDEEWEIEEE
mgnify:CR=1 FL=1